MQEETGYKGLTRLEVIRKLNVKSGWINQSLYKLLLNKDMYVLIKQRDIRVTVKRKDSLIKIVFYRVRL